jgi:cation diffusion facilitator family transporter
MSQSHPDNHANHDHEHDHEHRLTDWWRGLFHPHAHGHSVSASDPALSNARGIWAVKVSLIALLVTAVFQLFIVNISGSVALLADTLHNFSDALTAVPLWLAFTLARRPRNVRYTYGYGRAEDLAGVLIVVMIFFSAIEVLHQSVEKVVYPQPVTNLGWITLAAIVGFVGNEAVAIFRLRIGREIGSAALIADGLHARTDGFTSLGVLVGVIGVALGFPLADPLMGLGIGITILIVTWKAARDMWYRLMDAIDPEVGRSLAQITLRVPGVLAVRETAVRWLGHRQRAELSITVAADLSVVQGHQIAEVVRHDLFHELPALANVVVHVDPEGHEFHSLTAHHRSAVSPPK